MLTIPSVFSHTSSISSFFAPKTAAIVPSPTGTAFCIKIPRSLTTFTASSNVKTEEAINALYSPRLNPTVTSGLIPIDSTFFKIAVLAVSIATCVYSVIFNWSFSLKQRSSIENPRRLVAVSNTALLSSNCS